MLYLKFYLGEDIYVIKATEVIEVIPLIKLTRIPKTPEYVVGMFNYRGTTIPVIDMRHLIKNQPSFSIMSTRIILVNFEIGLKGGHILGLIAEHVTDMLHLNDESFVDPLGGSNESGYMSKIVSNQAGVIQRIAADKLLPEHVLEILFIKDRDGQFSQVL